MSNEISKNNAEDFGEILSIIEKARENTFRAVNRELISMYWHIGKYVSELCLLCLGRTCHRYWCRAAIPDSLHTSCW